MILVTAAFPFVPADLNIAHFASTYIPADISCRLLKTIGEDAQLASATDYHSIYASSNGVSTDRTLCDEYHKKYQHIYDAMNVKFDQYITTEDDVHSKNVLQSFLKMQRKGLIYPGLDNDTVCEQCGCSLPDRFVVNTTSDFSCPFCGSTQIDIKRREHYFLKIKDSAADLKAFSNGISQRDVRNVVTQYSRELNADWDITRYNHLGITVPGKSDQSFYIWFDSLIGYYSLALQSGIMPERMIHFIGKNIIYHHTALWQPIVSTLMGKRTQIDVSARGFLNFDKTDSSMIDPVSLSERFDADFIRFYIAFKVKDSISDFIFHEDDFINIVNHYCCRMLGGFFYKVWYAVKDVRNMEISLVGKTMESEAFIKEMQSSIYSSRIHDALRLVLKRVEIVRALIPDRNKKLSAEEGSQLLYETAVILSFLSCYMPSVAIRYSIFENWVPSTTEEAETCCMHSIKREKEMVKLDA